MNSNDLDRLWAQSDQQFFRRNPDRYSHIRHPWSNLGYIGTSECEKEFKSLGEHFRHRRRILLWRMPEEHPLFGKFPHHILKIPFIAFADETIEDRDDILLPIIDGIMKDAARSEGVES